MASGQEKGKLTPVKLHLKIDLVSHCTQAEGLDIYICVCVYIYIIINKYILVFI